MDSEKYVTNYLISLSLCAEQFLERVANDYGLPIDELKTRYLYESQKKFNKTIKKYKPKKTRKVTPYNIFLSDKKEISKLLKDNNTDNQTKINKQKGDLWEKYKNNQKIYEKYESISILENKGLLKKEYRRTILSDWKNKKKDIIKFSKQNNNVLKIEDILKKLKIT